MPPEVQAAVTTPEILAAISTLIVIFLGVVTANFTSKLKQIQEDTAEAKEQVTNSHSANFRDEVTQIVSDVKVISATLSKILGRPPKTPHLTSPPHLALRGPGEGEFFAF